MTKYGIAKQVITENFESSMYGLFNCYNLVGDPCRTVYHDFGIEILVCDNYGYIEVIGLSDRDFERLYKWWQKKALKNGWSWCKT